MQQRSQRYVRRRRELNVQTTDGAASAPIDWPAQQPDSAAGGTAPRGRRRRTHFDERIIATQVLVDYTPEDEANVVATSGLIEPHIGAVAGAVYRELLRHPETSAPFRDAAGTIDPKGIAAHQQEFEDWLLAAVTEPLDAATAEYLASVGMSYARRERPDGRIRARYLLSTVSRVQSLFVGILADAIPDPKQLGACTGAWCKRLMIHLDLMLAVYGLTESTAQWY